MGVWLAAYYDWWYDRVKTRPGLWLFLIFLSHLLLFRLFHILEKLDQPLWALALYGLALIIIVPAFFASCRRLKARMDAKTEELRRLRHLWRLIDRGKTPRR